jgi:hypothetical protein
MGTPAEATGTVIENGYVAEELPLMASQLALLSLCESATRAASYWAGEASDR